MPGQEKTLSVTTAPAIRLPIMKPMTVTVGIAALGSACQLTTRNQGTPLAVAVRMYGWPRISSIVERVKRARIPAPAVPRTTIGRIV